MSVRVSINSGRYVPEAALVHPKIREAEDLVVFVGDVSDALDHVVQAIAHVHLGNFVAAAWQLHYADEREIPVDEYDPDDDASDELDTADGGVAGSGA